jgi:hypothetical protein
MNFLMWVVAAVVCRAAVAAGMAALVADFCLLS